MLWPVPVGRAIQLHSKDSQMLRLSLTLFKNPCLHQQTETTYWAHGGYHLVVSKYLSWVVREAVPVPAPAWKLDLGFQHEAGTSSIK